MSKLFSYELISEGLADERLLENGFALSPRIVKKKLERLLEAEQQLKDCREFITKSDHLLDCHVIESIDGKCSCNRDELLKGGKG